MILLFEFGPFVFGPRARGGPGPAELLVAIEDGGAISGAARRPRVSHTGAGGVAEPLDRALGVPVVRRSPGSVRSGGASLTDAGGALIARCRRAEAAARREVTTLSHPSQGTGAR